MPMFPKCRGARSPRSKIVRLLSGFALAAALGFVSAPSQADGPVIVGEVSTSVGHEEVVPMMKNALVNELSMVKVPPGKKFVVSAALTKFETKGTTTSCVISLALRDASGNLKGVLLGSGAVVGKQDAKSTTLEVVNAAVRGATRELPAVVAQ